jgi:DNA-binding GntR family transcriptional regulator
MSSAAERERNGKREMTEGLAAQILDHIRSSAACGSTIIGASGNPFFLGTVRRINRVRRLLSYRSMVDRRRYRQQCEEHLQILDLLVTGRTRKPPRP